MNRKTFGVTLIVLLAMLLNACAQTAPQTPATTQAPVVQPTQAPAAQPTQAPAAQATQPSQAQPTATTEITPTTPPEAAGGKKVATFIFTEEFDTLNYYYSNMWFSQITAQLWNRWAWEFDDKLNPVPVMVKEMPSLDNGDISADGKTITLKLKDGLIWSDGQPLTSADFVFTWKMITDPKNTVASVSPYDLVKSIDTPDPTTVVMHFDEPYAAWQGTLWHGLLPQHVLQPVYDADGTLDNAEWNRKPTVGFGPYMFQDWESGSFARFVANPNWVGVKPKIDEIFIRFVPDDASQIAALKNKEGDLGTFIAYSDIPGLKDAGIQIKTVFSGYNEGWFFLIDKDLGNPALLDVRVRQAIAMAFNRDKIAQDLLLGLTKPAVTYWDNTPYADPTLKPYPYDPEQAKKLLDQAGWVDSNGDGVRDKNGVDLTLRYGTTTREVRQDTQAVAQQDLAAVGIKTELTNYDSDVFFAGFADNGPTYNGQLDIMEWSDTTEFPDPFQYYWLCSEIPTADNPSGTNSEHLCDPELDSLFKLQATQVDFKQRQATFQKISKLIYDQVYWLGVWQDPDQWALGSRLQNVSLSGATPFYNIEQWDLTQ
jgi:peptide/nickel transport system substrate-binding protein